MGEIVKCTHSKHFDFHSCRRGRLQRGFERGGEHCCLRTEIWEEIAIPMQKQKALNVFLNGLYACTDTNIEGRS